MTQVHNTHTRPDSTCLPQALARASRARVIAATGSYVLISGRISKACAYLISVSRLNLAILPLIKSLILGCDSCRIFCNSLCLKCLARRTILECSSAFIVKTSAFAREKPKSSNTLRFRCLRESPSRLILDLEPLLVTRINIEVLICLYLEESRAGSPVAQAFLPVQSLAAFCKAPHRHECLCYSKLARA